MKISGEYTPAGGVESYNSDFTLTADQKGNAYLYGTFAEGTNIVVNRDNELPVERQISFNTVAGKSYALDARSYFYIELNGWELNEMFKTKMANCRTIKFVPSSSDFGSEFYDYYGHYAGFVTNGDTLEFHTNADGFVAPDDCSFMFSNLSSLTTVDFGECFDTSNVTNMENMFSLCSKLVSLDLSGFDTSKVTDMMEMFNGCDNLASLDLSGFDTSKVTDMRFMFDSCRCLQSLDVSNFNTSQVSSMDYMFQECRALAELDLHSFTFSHSPTVKSMFNGIGSSLDLTEIPVCVSAEGKTYLDGQNYTDTKAKFVLP